MNSHQSHALAAGSALSRGLSSTLSFKASNAKVSLTGEQMFVVVTDKVAAHFPERVSVAMNLFGGKLIIEVRKDPGGRTQFSPLLPGQRKAAPTISGIKGCSPSFPKFGMTQPESVVLGSDGVLRITLPAKRNPVVARRAKIVKPPATTKKELEVKAKEESKVDTISEVPVTPLASTSPDKVSAPAEPPKVMSYKDTMMSRSRSGLQIRVGRELAKFIDGGYGITTLGRRGDGTVVVVIRRGAAPYRLGVTTFPPNDSIRSIKILSVPEVKDVPFFGMTQVDQVEVRNDGVEIEFRISGELALPGARAGTRRVAPRKRSETSAPVTAPVTAEDRLTKLRRLRDEINAIVQEITDAGDTVLLKFKDDGKTLGFTYEG